MKLGMRLSLSMTVMVACTALLGAAALLGLNGLSRHFQAAEEQYDELRAVYEIGHHVAVIRILLTSEAPDMAAVRARADDAIDVARSLRDPQKPRSHQLDSDFESRLQSIQSQLQEIAAKSNDTTNVAVASNNMNTMLGSVASLASQARSEIINNRQRASARFNTTMNVMACAFAFTILAGVMTGLTQHRAVMKPVTSLGQAVAQLSSANFSHRIPETGDRELRDLIQHFNRMSCEIDRLHTSMRQQVETKSRELVRSEQLASVGHLAAGIAHEINNPLGIIAGYAEMTLKRLNADDTATDQTRNAISIICDEAFRCRDITNELLQMTRPLDSPHEPVGMTGIVNRAVSLVRVLPVCVGKSIEINSDEVESQMIVSGSKSQLLQVLINIITNALEACENSVGLVRIALERTNDDVVVSITDNGSGMNEHALVHAFDPFFTEKPQRGMSGTGLGLSVSHAIVQRHAGRLFAQSDGRGRGGGSTFTIQIPAIALDEVDHVEFPGVTSFAG